MSTNYPAGHRYNKRLLRTDTISQCGKVNIITGEIFSELCLQV